MASRTRVNRGRECNIHLQGTHSACLTGAEVQILTLYWYKSTNTDAEERQANTHFHLPCPEKYKY